MGGAHRSHTFFSPCTPMMAPCYLRESSYLLNAVITRRFFRLQVEFSHGLKLTLPCSQAMVPSSGDKSVTVRSTLKHDAMSAALALRVSVLFSPNSLPTYWSLCITLSPSWAQTPLFFHRFDSLCSSISFFAVFFQTLVFVFRWFLFFIFQT